MTGGSTSGTVGFPTYMQSYHNQILGTPDNFVGGNLSTIGSALLQVATPYSGVAAVEVLPHLSSMSVAVDNLLYALNPIDLKSIFAAGIDSMLSVVNDQNDFPKANILNEMQANALDDAVAKAVGVGNTAIAGMSATLEAESKATLYDEIGRLAASAVEINNAQTSSFMIGLALLEAQYQSTVGIAKAKLRSDNFTNTLNLLLSADIDLAKMQISNKNELLDKGASLGAQSAIAKHQFLSEYTKLVIEYNRMAIVAKHEEISQNLDFDVKDALWDIDVLMRMVQAVAGLGPGTFVPPATSKNASALGGALSAAATAASLTGNPFVIAGAGVLGGLAGLL